MPLRRRREPEWWAVVRLLHREGLSVSLIAALLDVSVPAVYYALSDGAYRAMRRDRQHRPTTRMRGEPEWWALARDQHNAGWTRSQIAAHHGVSRSAVDWPLMDPAERTAARTRSAANTRAARSQYRRPERAGEVSTRTDWYREAAELRARGWTILEIAKRLDVWESTVYRALKLYPGPGKKICAVCLAEFASPPSDRKATCGPECSSIHRSRRHQGVRNVWTDEGRANAREAAQRTGNLALGTPAARESPLAGPFETNQEAKSWLVVAPGGAPTFEARNLRLWCEQHADLFAPDDWRAAYRGLRQVSAWWRGKTKRKVSQWKGWTLDGPPRS